MWPYDIFVPLLSAVHGRICVTGPPPTIQTMFPWPEAPTGCACLAASALFRQACQKQSVGDGIRYLRRKAYRGRPAADGEASIERQ
jgi:hypothetical protein